jgi:hypothetical protein
MISGGSAVIFKGEGFWETDYNRSKEYATKKKEETGATTKSADTAKGDTAKSDTKGTTKTDAKPAQAATPAPAPQPAPAAAKPKPGGGKPAGPAT